MAKERDANVHVTTIGELIDMLSKYPRDTKVVTGYNGEDDIFHPTISIYPYVTTIDELDKQYDFKDPWFELGEDVIIIS